MLGPLTSSPAIKTLPGGIVLTIWAVRYETKESRGLVADCIVKIPAVWERRQVGPGMLCI